MPPRFCYATLEACLRVRNRGLNLIDPPILVLLYHRVAALDADPHQLAVSPENFRAQLRFLKDHFPVIRCDDEWSDLQKPAVAISFDDGYADNVLQALPVLEEFGLPATFFVTSGHVDTRWEFWWDDLERILFATEGGAARFRLEDDEFGGSWPVSTPSEKERLLRELHLLIKRVGAERRARWFEQLRAWADVDAEGRASHRPLSLEELRRLGASPLVTVGAHTVTHTPLASLSIDEQQSEVMTAKQQLEDWLGEEISLFSYPFGGREDYTKQTVDMLRKSSFSKSFANIPGQVHRWSDSHQLPRMLVRDWPPELFAQQLNRFWTL